MDAGDDAHVPGRFPLGTPTGSSRPSLTRSLRAVAGPVRAADLVKDAGAWWSRHRPVAAASVAPVQQTATGEHWRGPSTQWSGTTTPVKANSDDGAGVSQQVAQSGSSNVVDSEEEMLRRALAESQADADSHSMLSEQEQRHLEEALEASRTDVAYTSEPESVVWQSGGDDADRELSRALQESERLMRQASLQARSSVHGDDIPASHRESRWLPPGAAPLTEKSHLDEDRMLELAIQLSLEERELWENARRASPTIPDVDEQPPQAPALPRRPVRIPPPIPSPPPRCPRRLPPPLPERPRLSVPFPSRNKVPSKKIPHVVQAPTSPLAYSPPQPSFDFETPDPPQLSTSTTEATSFYSPLISATEDSGSSTPTVNEAASFTQHLPLKRPDLRNVDTTATIDSYHTARVNTALDDEDGRNSTPTHSDETTTPTNVGTVGELGESTPTQSGEVVLEPPQNSTSDESLDVNPLVGESQYSPRPTNQSSPVTDYLSAGRPSQVPARVNNAVLMATYDAQRSLSLISERTEPITPGMGLTPAATEEDDLDQAPLSHIGTYGSRYVSHATPNDDDDMDEIQTQDSRLQNGSVGDDVETPVREEGGLNVRFARDPSTPTSSFPTTSVRTSTVEPIPSTSRPTNRRLVTNSTSRDSYGFGSDVTFGFPEDTDMLAPTASSHGPNQPPLVPNKIKLGYSTRQSGEGRQQQGPIWVVDAKTWSLLLRFLMWWGESQLEAVEEDVDPVVGRGLAGLAIAFRKDEQGQSMVRLIVRLVDAEEDAGTASDVSITSSPIQPNATKIALAKRKLIRRNKGKQALLVKMGGKHTISLPDILILPSRLSQIALTLFTFGQLAGIAVSTQAGKDVTPGFKELRRLGILIASLASEAATATKISTGKTGDETLIQRLTERLKRMKSANSTSRNNEVVALAQLEENSTLAINEVTESNGLPAEPEVGVAVMSQNHSGINPSSMMNSTNRISSITTNTESDVSSPTSYSTSTTGTLRQTPFSPIIQQSVASSSRLRPNLSRTISSSSPLTLPTTSSSSSHIYNRQPFQNDNDNSHINHQSTTGYDHDRQQLTPASEQEPKLEHVSDDDDHGFRQWEDEDQTRWLPTLTN